MGARNHSDMLRISNGLSDWQCLRWWFGKHYDNTTVSSKLSNCFQGLWFWIFIGVRRANWRQAIHTNCPNWSLCQCDTRRHIAANNINLSILSQNPIIAQFEHLLANILIMSCSWPERSTAEWPSLEQTLGIVQLDKLLANSDVFN